MNTFNTRPGRRLALILLSLGALVLTGCGGPPAAKIGRTEITSYVALGDGYAAAPYAGKAARAKGCLRSADNYPAQLAERLHISDFTDNSCTYARTQALTRSTRPQMGHNGKVDAQLDALTKDTGLVTLSMGLSDRDIINDLFNVCTQQPCGENQKGAQQLVTQLSYVGVSLSDKVEEILNRAPGARVFVVGYPQFLPDEGSCPQMPKLSQDQLDVANALLTQLNSQLASAARSSGADFVDMASISEGHDMCADDPWVNGKRTNKKKALKFHPLQAEQDAVADELAAELK